MLDSKYIDKIAQLHNIIIYLAVAGLVEPRVFNNAIQYNTIQYNTIVDAPYVTSESEARDNDD